MEDQKVTRFDKAKRKPAGKAIDLDAPFFEERHPEPRDYSKCDHSRLGFQFDKKMRKVYCRCGEEVDAFDAIVALAYAEKRLQSTRAVIEDDARKKAEEKAKKPFVKKVTGFEHHYDRKGVPLARDYRLECGHTIRQHRGRGFNRHWKQATCTTCFRAAELAKKPISVVS
jgi:hypothetical protein